MYIIYYIGTKTSDSRLGLLTTNKISGKSKWSPFTNI